MTSWRENMSKGLGRKNISHYYYIEVIKRVASGYGNAANVRQRILLTMRKKTLPEAARGLPHLLP
jgi:hypothetical protein